MQRHRFAAQIAVVIACVALLTAKVALAAPEDDYNLAVGLYKKERWDEAAQAFRNFLKGNAEHRQAENARLYLGLSLVNSQDHAAARDVLREFARLHPASKNLPDALYRVGEASYSLEDYAKAEKDLLAFLAKYGDHELAEWALPYLADSQLRLGKPHEAARHFEQAIKNHPQGSLIGEAKFGLARTYEELKKPAEAAKLYRELASAAGTRAAAAQLRVATLLYDAGDYPEAATEFAALVSRFPQSPLAATARLNAGFALYRSGEYAKALEQLEAAAKDPDQEATATHWIGMSRKALGNSAGASEAFRIVVEQHRESPLAAESLFQWADTSLRTGAYDEAAERFEQFARLDPKGPQASDAIHFAGEAALLAGDLDRAEALVERFTKEYGRTSYRMHNRLLAGRILEARAEKATTEAREKLEGEALAEYSAVLEGTEIEATKAKARFQLARLHERRNEPAKAIEAIGPLVESITRDGAKSDYLDALIIAARAKLAIKDARGAIDAASTYLDDAPDGDQADAALAVRSIAHLEAAEPVKAKADWATLRRQHPKSDLLVPTTRDLAERAYDSEKWSLSAEFFAALAEIAAGRPEEAIGLSGLGWSLHKAGEYPESAEAFGRLLERRPDATPLAPEAAYMKGKALQDAGELNAAAAAYKAAFDQFGPVEAAEEGGEAEGALRNAWLAGLQLARVLRLQKKIEEADAAYAAVAEAFPRSRNFDELLDEWALLHYEAEDFEKADAIYRRLIAEAPASPAASNAKLSLAESALFGGRPEAARPALEELAGDEKTPVQVRQRAQSLLVSLAAERGDWKATETLAQEFVSEHTESGERPIVLYQLGESLLQQQQPEKAAEVLRQVELLREDEAVRSAPWFPRIYVLLAEAAFQQKEYEAAVAHAEQVKTFAPAPTYAYLADEVLGRVAKNRAKFDEARDAFGRVLDDENARRTATAARAQYEIAQTYFLQQRWEEARTAAFKVYTLYKFPEWQAPALYMAALSDEALGEKEKAAAAFADVVKEFPETDYADQARQKLARLGRSAG